jgi:hypothetical protein
LEVEVQNELRDSLKDKVEDQLRKDLKEEIRDDVYEQVYRNGVLSEKTYLRVKKSWHPLDNQIIQQKLYIIKVF